MNRALFRADASAAVGGGHIMRCLTLADALKSRGWTCAFACTPETVQTVPVLLSSGHAIMGADEGVLDIDVLIVDHYGLDYRYEAAARSWARRVVVLDDLADRRHDCDLLIDQTLGRDPEEYKTLVPDGCRIFSGTAYALLRPQFAAARPAALSRRRENAGKIARILVMMGTGDQDNATGLALSALELLEKTLAVDVILGTDAPHLRTVRQQAQHSRHKIEVHAGTNEVAVLMARADLCIGAGGTASWERCCMGLPTLIIQVADNQRDIIQALVVAQAASMAGIRADLTPQIIAAAVLRLIDDPSTITDMEKAVVELCSGTGTTKIISELEKMVI